MAHRVVEDLGPSHERRFVCAVEVTIEEERILQMSGYEKSRVKEAQNSAASLMLMALLGT